MPLQLRETNIANTGKHNRLKNPNWQEADQLAIYKCDQGVELVVSAGLEPATFGFQVQ